MAIVELKIVCLNLWHGGDLFDAVLKFLAEQDADILMLQEVYNATDRSLPENYRSIQVLQEKLKNYPYVDFAPAILDAMPLAKVLSGNAVLSKFPLASHEPIFLMNRLASVIQKILTDGRRLLETCSTLPSHCPIPNSMSLTFKASGI